MVFVGGQYTQGDAPHDHYARLAELNLPTVLVNAPIAELRFPDRLDGRRGRERAGLESPRQLGHTSIGLVLGPDGPHPVAAQARRRHAQVAEAAGRRIGERLVVHSHYSLEAGQAAATRLLDGGRHRRSSACRDPIALGAIRAVRRAGLRVPEDVSIVGFDDSALMNCDRPAAHDGAPADRADGPHDHRAAGEPDERSAIAQPTSTCSSPNWWSADRPDRRRRRTSARSRKLLLLVCLVLASFLSRTLLSACHAAVDPQRQPSGRPVLTPTRATVGPSHAPPATTRPAVVAQRRDLPGVHPQLRRRQRRRHR